MKIIKYCLMTGLAFGLPFAARAQQNVAKATRSDITYCHALSLAYVGMHPETGGWSVGEVMALEGCDTDTAKSTATIERMLKNDKVELPPRSVAQDPASMSGTPCSGLPTSTSCVIQYAP